MQLISIAAAELSHFLWVFVPLRFLTAVYRTLLWFLKGDTFL